MVLVFSAAEECVVGAWVNVRAEARGEDGVLGGGLGFWESFEELSLSDVACILIEEFQLESSKRR